MEPMTEADRALLAKARETIERRFRSGRHHVASALRTRDGRVFTGLHLETTIGRAAICAEAVAIGKASEDDDLEIDSIVSVDRHGNVLSPCGLCRELLADFSPGCRVIVPGEGGEEVVAISELLPNKYRRLWRDRASDP